MTIGIFKTVSVGAQNLFDLLKDTEDVQFIGLEDVEQGLSSYEVVIFPGGAEYVLPFISNPLFRQGVTDYVSNGGLFLGICGGAMLAGLLRLGGCYVSFMHCFPYYIYYKISKNRLQTDLLWIEDNVLGLSGTTTMTWNSSPTIRWLGSLHNEAVYAGLIPFRQRGLCAIASGTHGAGKIYIICPHPDIPNGGSNYDIIIKALGWLRS